MNGQPVLEVRKLTVGLALPRNQSCIILRDIDLVLNPGETLGIVGESGSGKSTLLAALMGHFAPGFMALAGDVRVADRNVLFMERSELTAMRGKRVGLVPQNAGQCLTPNLTIGGHLREQLVHKARLSGSQAETQSLELLRAVQIRADSAMLARYPHQLSGGQQQRIAIALALAGDPDILLLDEPTTALDVTTKVNVLDILANVARTRSLSMIYVSHDIGVIARTADRVAVMYAGEVVETGSVRQVLLKPHHPYTQALLAAVPNVTDRTMPRPLAGAPPLPTTQTKGCTFAPRCRFVEGDCLDAAPALIESGYGQSSRCFRGGPEPAPDVGELDLSSGDVTRQPLLEVRNLSVRYEQGGLFATLFGSQSARRVIRSVDLDVARGEILSLVGESGSGKSTILKAIAGLTPARSGTVHLHGEAGALPSDVADRTGSMLKRIQLIFQNPDESLNPRRSVGTSIARPLTVFGTGRPDLGEQVSDLLSTVRLDPVHASRIPGQLSGGEKQRIAIARALAAEPDLLLCDEITSALDVSVQAAVLELIAQLRRDRGVAIVFVSHDLAVVRQISDRVAILLAGEIVEEGPVDHVFGSPLHPYTRMLLASVADTIPDDRETTGQDRPVIPERVVNGEGCPFAGRCSEHLAGICDRHRPELVQIAHNHQVACHRTGT